MTKAVVVMGSASPDLSSYYKGLRKEYSLLTLPHRVSGNGNSSEGNHAQLASVEIVDMRNELREGNREIFSRALISSMGECLDKGGTRVVLNAWLGQEGPTKCPVCGSGVYAHNPGPEKRAE